jgi:hypothetical protein
LDGWPSGLTRKPGKRLHGTPCREFESRPIRFQLLTPLATTVASGVCRLRHAQRITALLSIRAVDSRRATRTPRAACRASSVQSAWSSHPAAGTPPFFDASVRNLDAPIPVDRIMVDGSGSYGSPDDLTRMFLESIKHPRFIELRRITGVAKHSSQYVNQLLDAFYIWCAEHNKAFALLTTD